MELNINLNETAIRNELQDEANKRISSVLRRSLDVHFQTGQYWGTKPGAGTLIINKLIDDYMLSDEFVEKTKNCITKHADAALDHACERMMKSASRKLLFTAVPHTPE